MSAECCQTRYEYEEKDHVKPILRHLHLLQVRSIMEYKTAELSYTMY